MSTVEVSPAGAPLDEVWRLALTFDGYGGPGGFEGAAEVANTSRARWAADGTLPDALVEARRALFFEQRRWRHFGVDPGEADERYVRALVERVRELSGGRVDVDEAMR